MVTDSFSLNSTLLLISSDSPQLSVPFSSPFDYSNYCSWQVYILLRTYSPNNCCRIFPRLTSSLESTVLYLDSPQLSCLVLGTKTQSTIQGQLSAGQFDWRLNPRDRQGSTPTTDQKVDLVQLGYCTEYCRVSRTFPLGSCQVVFKGERPSHLDQQMSVSSNMEIWNTHNSRPSSSGLIHQTTDKLHT
jgi:hypothetical protein